MAKRATAKTAKRTAPKVKAPKTSKRKGTKHVGSQNLVVIPKGGRKRADGTHIGRAKGQKNKFTTLLKDAILEAAERCGHDGKGKDGAVGYLMWLARREPAVYGRMLEKVMPMQLEVKDTSDKRYTPEEAIARLRERGLPVPQSLTTLAAQVGQAVHNLQEEDYEAELNGVEPVHDADEVDGEDDEDENEDEQEEETSDS